MDVSPIAANLYQGTLAGGLSVQAAATPVVAVKQNLSGISMGPLLKDAANFDSLEGKGNLSVDVSGQGNTVTAIKMPEGVASQDVQAAVREEFDIELAIGQGGLTSKLIRVGHLGWVSDKDISEVMTALKTVMPRFWKS